MSIESEFGVSPEPVHGVSRRHFLKGVAVVGTAALVLPGFSPNSVQAAQTGESDTAESPTIQTQLEARPSASAPPEQEARPIEPSYLDSAKKGLMLSGASVVLAKVLHWTGIKSGNALLRQGPLAQRKTRDEALVSLSEIPRRKILKSVGYVAVKAPVAEEAIFRGVPSTALNMLGVKGSAWPVGVLSAVAFASIHSVNPQNGAKTIPVEQFGLGLMTWALTRDRGVDHAMVAHAANNLPFATIIAGMYEYSRMKTEPYHN